MDCRRYGTNELLTHQNGRTLTAEPFPSSPRHVLTLLCVKNEDKGGSRSEASAAQSDAQPGQRSAIDSVYGKGQAGEFNDLSGPQGKTKQDSSEEEDRRAKELLGKFGQLNGVRALLMGAGGIVGLITALA